MNCCGNNNKIKIANVSNEQDTPTGLILIISLISLIVSFFISYYKLPLPGFPLIDPAWVAIFLCGYPIIQSAYIALKEDKKITSALLISIAIFASIILQFFITFYGDNNFHHESTIFAAGEIAFLMALGEMLENRTLKKSRNEIENLIKLSPKQALRKTNTGEEEIVLVEDLNIGDIILIRPNDMIPADGKIIDGASSINQANMTGESIPVDKKAGEYVLAGTWNISGSLTIKVTKRSNETTLARLIKIVSEAESQKAPIVNIADRWATRIVPAAIISSILVFSFAFWILDKNFTTALIRGVTILVVFCPCAFALATPTAIAAGIGNAAKRGVLIKNGEAIEKLSNIGIVAFDKTGTLTKAELKIESIYSTPLFNEKEVIRISAAAEKHSQHPIAKAIIYAAKNLTLPNVKNIFVQNGIGISCDTEDSEIQIRSRASLLNTKITLNQSEKEFSDTHSAHGETLVYLIIDNAIAGIIALSDTIRENASSTIHSLHKQNIHTAMLTGDNAEAGKHIGQIIGVNEIFAEQLPNDKAQTIKKLRKKIPQSTKNILMVGDGVNDAPALAVADCSIAMGALGAELAIETADITILNNNISLIDGLIKFSKAVLRTIHTNFAISLSINFIAIILSAFGILDPVSGAIVHNASSVLVVVNSASLLARKKDFKQAQL